MRKPNTAKATVATDLRLRAARARDAAGRFIKRGGGEVTDQPQSASLPEASAADRPGSAFSPGPVTSHDAVRGHPDRSSRADAVAGREPCREQDMGRHETFGNASPIVDQLLTGTILGRRVEHDRDPVLALIEAHRSAFTEYDRLASIANDLPPTDPGYKAASVAAEEPGRREIATYEALFRAKPTTLDGTLSLAAYLCEAVRAAQIDDKPSDGERALHTITEALQGFGQVHAHPDVSLFALGAAFVAAWSAEVELDSGEGYRACNQLAQQIVQTPAVTVAGLGIKALLLARLDEDDSSPRQPAKAQGPIASHWNVLRQVQEGAARFAVAPDMGIPMSAAATSDQGVLITDTLPTSAGLVGLLDLASASWDDLRSVRDLADHVGTFAYSLAWTDRCRARWQGAPSDHYNAAGKLMQWLGEALSDVEEAAERAAERRVARGSRDRETRLAMLAVRVIENGDPEQTKAFAHELLDHATAGARGC